jgi:hypothetical protein
MKGKQTRIFAIYILGQGISLVSTIPFPHSASIAQARNIRNKRKDGTYGICG